MEKNKFTFEQAKRIKEDYYLVGRQMSDGLIIEDILIAPYDMKHNEKFINYYYQYRDDIKVLSLFNTSYYRLMSLIKSGNNCLYYDSEFLLLLRDNNIDFDLSKYTE